MPSAGLRRGLVERGALKQTLEVPGRAATVQTQPWSSGKREICATPGVRRRSAASKLRVAVARDACATRPLRGAGRGSGSPDLVAGFASSGARPPSQPASSRARTTSMPSAAPKPRRLLARRQRSARAHGSARASRGSCARASSDATSLAASPAAQVLGRCPEAGVARAPSLLVTAVVRASPRPHRQPYPRVTHFTASPTRARHRVE